MDLSCKDNLAFQNYAGVKNPASRDQSPISLKYPVPHFYGVIVFKTILFIQTWTGTVIQACKIFLFAENGFIDA